MLAISNSCLLKNRVKTKLSFHTVFFLMHPVYHFYLVYQPDFVIMSQLMSQLQKNPYFSYHIVSNPAGVLQNHGESASFLYWENERKHLILLTFFHVTLL